MDFQLLDVVRIVQLLLPQRYIDASNSVSEPAPGETGTIVEILDDGRYLVEGGDEGDDPLWLAELSAEELELEERPTRR